MNTGIDYILEKKAIKKAEQKVKDAEVEASRENNYIVLEKNAVGLYSCKYALGGSLPPELKTKFTSRNKILAICNQRGIKVKE